MAVLTNQERREVSSQFQQGRAFGVLLKADVQAAVDALDNFLDSGPFLTAINNQLPEPAKSTLPPGFKRELLGLILRKRLGI